MTTKRHHYGRPRRLKPLSKRLSLKAQVRRMKRIVRRTKEALE